MSISESGSPSYQPAVGFQVIVSRSIAHRNRYSAIGGWRDGHARLASQTVSCQNPRTAMKVLIPFILLLSACAPVEPKDDLSQQSFPAVWDVRFFGKQGEGLGSMRLELTTEPIDDAYCGKPYFWKAVVLESDIDVELWRDVQPAYHIYARWLSVDLTASTCNVNYVLMGNIDRESASGFFNFSHPLGGENLGRFEAVPVVRE